MHWTKTVFPPSHPKPLLLSVPTRLQITLDFLDTAQPQLAPVTNLTLPPKYTQLFATRGWIWPRMGLIVNAVVFLIGPPVSLQAALLAS